jgi:hypothetical protein
MLELVRGELDMRDFEAFFRAATGHEPYGYQARIARDGLPDVVTDPTLARGRAVWRFDGMTWEWVKITASGQCPARSGELLLVNAAGGGYDLRAGFDPSAQATVADCPVLLTTMEREAISAGVEDDSAADPASDEPRQWMSLDQHSREVRDHTEALLTVLAPWRHRRRRTP